MYEGGWRHGKDVVGLAAKQQIERTGEHLADDLAGLLVEQRREPAAEIIDAVNMQPAQPLNDITPAEVDAMPETNLRG